jgi:hypothetical protein
MPRFGRNWISSASCSAARAESRWCPVTCNEKTRPTMSAASSTRMPGSRILF